MSEDSESELRKELDRTISLGRTPQLVILGTAAYYLIAISSVAWPLITEAARRRQAETDLKVLRAAAELELAAYRLQKSSADNLQSLGAPSSIDMAYGGPPANSYYGSWLAAITGTSVPYGYGSETLIRVEPATSEELKNSQHLLDFAYAASFSCTPTDPRIYVPDPTSGVFRGPDIETRFLPHTLRRVWFYSQSKDFIGKLEQELADTIAAARGDLEERAAKEPELENPQESPAFGNGFGGFGSGDGDPSVGGGGGFFRVPDDKLPTDFVNLAQGGGGMAGATWENASAAQKLYWLDKAPEAVQLTDIHGQIVAGLDADKLELVAANLGSIVRYASTDQPPESVQLHTVIAKLEKEVDSVPDFMLPVISSSVPADVGLIIAGPLLLVLFHYWLLCFLKIRRLETELVQKVTQQSLPTWSGRLFTQHDSGSINAKLNWWFGILMLFVFPIAIPFVLGILMTYAFWVGGVLNLACACLMVVDLVVTHRECKRLNSGSDLLCIGGNAS